MSTPDVVAAQRSARTGLAVLSVLGFLSGAAFAQPVRIPGRIDPNRRAVLRGFTTPRAVAELDRGAVEPSIRLSSLSLMLNRTAAQQEALDRLLVDQLDPSSPDYHNWLTPEQFADRFSLGADDFEKVTAWLTSEGFAVDYAGRARNWILFSGSAAQVENTFQTHMRRYLFDGEMRYANAWEPSVPDAIAGLIAYLSLNDFPMTARKPRPRPVAPFEGTPGTPLANLNDGSHVVVPGDLATIYNVNSLYQMGLDGSGIKMAIVGVSDIHMSDMRDFRTQFGLPQNDPQVILVPGSTDPGYNDAEGEADLDLQYAGGMAPKATLLYVNSTNPVNSALYAVEQNLAPIISMSFGGCEQLITSQPLQFADAYRQLAQQANAQGITWMVSSGDSGAAACDQGGPALAVNGLDVNVLASVPEVTGVGGTMFNEGSGNYWSPTANSDYSSALSYIPEATWNDTAVMGTIWSSGGGVSAYYSKPSWQAGAGVPNDGHRDVPDVSLTASGHDAYYVMTQGKFGGVMGTSASCPSFAGMVALLNQYLLSTGKITKPGLANINPNLYHLAEVSPGVYHDVTSGTNIVPCKIGTKDCTTGQIGYRAGPGYDQVTGWGSVDAYKLITGWNATSVTATTTTVSASPGAITTNSATTLTASVTAAGGTPSGQVTFVVGSVTLGAATLAGSGATATGSLTVAGSRLSVGTNTITAFYGGGSGFNGSSGAVNVTVSIPSGGSAAIASVVPTPVYQQAADADGYSWFYTIRLSEIGGVATTLTAFSIDSTDYTGNIQSWFGSSNLPAHGTLSASLRTKGLTNLPVNRVYTFKGVDGSGAQWTQQISVPFMSQQIAASMLVTSSPATVAPTPTASSGCDTGYDFYQELNLQERNGYEVQLTKFVAGGFDLTENIPDWFGSWRLAPLGTLQAEICWSLDTVPETIDYQIEGIDTSGHKITATASIAFNPAPGQSGGALSSSVKTVNLAVSSGQSASTTLGVVIAAGQQWSATLFPANQKSSWLVVSPQSGTGPATITLAASAAGLATGVYTATLVLQSTNTLPQFVNVPITFTIGGSSSVVISGISNTFSGGAAFAPGMLLTVYGTNLAGSTQPEAGSPLPTRLAGVSASINGVLAPLYYVSPGQVNLQVPYEAPVGPAILAINNNGLVATYRFKVQAAAPGATQYLWPAGSVTPVTSASPGQSLVTFMTGEGDVLPFVVTGNPPAGTALTQPPAPRLDFTMTVGGAAVTPQFVGIPSWSIGVTQVNFAVPAKLAPGVYPVVFTVGGVPSAPIKLTVGAASANVLVTFVPPSVDQASDGGWHYKTQFTETGGAGVNLTKLMVFGKDYTSQLSAWFGATRVPANGTISGSFVATCTTCSPPWDGTWQVSGTDDNGNSNTWSGTVHFLAASTSGTANAAKGKPRFKGNFVGNAVTFSSSKRR